MRCTLLIFLTFLVASTIAQVTESSEHYAAVSAPQLDAELDYSATVTGNSGSDEANNEGSKLDKADSSAAATRVDDNQVVNLSEVEASEELGSIASDNSKVSASEINNEGGEHARAGNERVASSCEGSESSSINVVEGIEPLSAIDASGAPVEKSSEGASSNPQIDETATSNRVLTSSRGSGGSLVPNKTSANLQPPSHRMNLGARARLPPQVPSKKTPLAILKTAGQKALGGGASGAAAGIIQVLSMMWLRTIMNYQYRYGLTARQAARALWLQGGLPRFYRGVFFALLQGPLARFGATAANEAMLSVVAEAQLATSPLWMAAATAAASAAAGTWRWFIMPLDTCKTILQVDGALGFRRVMEIVGKGHVGRLYQGALASAAATALGHFPWFATFNWLNAALTVPASTLGKLLRNAGIGLSASLAADLLTNWIRVVKTTKQTAVGPPLSYRETVALLLAEARQGASSGDSGGDGQKGNKGGGGGFGALAFRGLGTRVVANGLQSMIFTVCWRYFRDREATKQALEAETAEASTTLRESLPDEEQESPEEESEKKAV